MPQGTALKQFNQISAPDRKRHIPIMGLETIDPHSHKVQTKLYKMPKFDVNRPNSKQDAAIRKC